MTTLLHPTVWDELETIGSSLAHLVDCVSGVMCGVRGASGRHTGGVELAKRGDKQTAATSPNNLRDLIFGFRTTDTSPHVGEAFNPIRRDEVYTNASLTYRSSTLRSPSPLAGCHAFEFVTKIMHGVGLLHRSGQHQPVVGVGGAGVTLTFMATSHPVKCLDARVTPSTQEYLSKDPVGEVVLTGGKIHEVPGLGTNPWEDGLRKNVMCLVVITRPRWVVLAILNERQVSTPIDIVGDFFFKSCLNLIHVKLLRRKEDKCN